MEIKEKDLKKILANLINQLMLVAGLFLLMILLFMVISLAGNYRFSSGEDSQQQSVPETTASTETTQIETSAIPPIAKGEMWMAPDTNELRPGSEKEEILYGRDLIANTSKYLGPKGSVAHISNGMNCQNCHLSAGTVPFGNNYSAVSSTFPKLRGRSGMVEGIPKRVNDCFERSLNGKALTDNSKEMKAIVAYLNWLGKDVPKDEKPAGVGIYKLAYLNREANPESGKTLYLQKCQSCHGADGSGLKNPDEMSYTYPPLWGKNSYNIGAGLFRLSSMAGYIKANMPLGSTYKNPQLTDEEAWDIAAFVNSMDRPKKDLSADWPDIKAKPVDHPFGPYSDKFSEKQHKFGPFKPIEDFKKSNTKTKG